MFVVNEVKQRYCCACREGTWGRRNLVPLIINLGPDGGKWSDSRFERFAPGQRALSIHLMEGRV
jgi:hypothetical protein